MEKIWAPWRSHDRMQEGYEKWDCLFCGIASSKEDRKNLVLARSEHSITIMNLYPYNSGHVMVAPYRHTAEFETLTTEEILDIGRAVQKAVSVLKRIYHPNGFNIGFNLGEAAGAGVADHLHCHIVPRWVGDSNFMPIIGKTKVISCDPCNDYDRLAAAWME